MSFRPIGSASLPAKPAAAVSAGEAAAPTTSTPASAATPTGSTVASPALPNSATSAASLSATAAAGAGYAYPGYDASNAAGYDYSAYYAAYGYNTAGGAAAGSSTSAYPGYGAGAYGGYGGYDASGYGTAGSFGTTDEELHNQQSIYTPDNSEVKQQFTKKAQKGQARTTVLRKGAGQVWEDQTLMEWDPKHFRLFVGDLGNDVNDDDLVKAFGTEKGWSSFVKAKVVRDKVTNKTRGYGFVSYSDPEDFMKAWKAMNGKYVGSRPVKIQKATTQVRQVDIGDKKARELDTQKKDRVIGNKVRGALNPHGTWKPYIRR